MKTVKQLLNNGVNYLNDYSIENSFLDCQLLLMKSLKWNKIKLLTHLDELIDESIEKKYNAYLTERTKGKPIQYILGYREFMGLNFIVNENVLVPRPDTEILVESIISLYEKTHFDLIMDIGTGSGCIPISLCYFLKGVKAIGVDISDEALKVAKSNSIKNKQDNNISFIHSNLFNNVPKKMHNKCDIIISNPPYIPSNDINKLMLEVKKYEPRTALDGGIDGLDFYRKIIKKAKSYLIERGYIAFEVGYKQSRQVAYLLKLNGYGNIDIKKDLSGIERVVIGQKITL